MKKLLVLMLILALASLANAAIEWSLSYDDITGVVSLDITNNEGQMYIGMAVDSSEATLSGFAAGDDAPQDTDQFAILPDDLEGYGQGELWAAAHITTGPQVFNDGEWLVADFDFASGVTSATVSALSFDEETETCAVEATILIPEPATIALLCFGGLLLRKK